jgi:hypothetical protein
LEFFPNSIFHKNLAHLNFAHFSQQINFVRLNEAHHLFYLEVGIVFGFGGLISLSIGRNNLHNGGRRGYGFPGWVQLGNEWNGIGAQRVQSKFWGWLAARHKLIILEESIEHISCCFEWIEGTYGGGEGTPANCFLLQGNRIIIFICPAQCKGDTVNMDGKDMFWDEALTGELMNDKIGRQI